MKTIYALLGLLLAAAHIGVFVFAAVFYLSGDYPKATWLILLSISATLQAINLKIGKT